MRRHLYYYTHILVPADTAAAIIAGAPAHWLPAPAEAASDGWRVTLDADGALPSGLARRDAIVAVGPATPHSGEGVARRLTWRAAHVERLFPVLDADLEIAALQGGGSHISLMGTYRPPLAVVGGIAETVVGHRVAEACVRRFILDVAGRIVSGAGTLADAPR